MVYLAGFASFLFPGTGQAFTGQLRLAVVWAIAATLALVGMAWLPHVGFASIAIRVVSSIDAVRKVKRSAAGTQYLTSAGILAGAQAGVFVLVRLFVLESATVMASSMAPTLNQGDHMFVNKLAPRFTGYHRGDVVLFDHPIGYRFVKRIAAVGGDELAVRAGVLHVNGRAVPRTELGPTSHWDNVESDRWLERDVIQYEETLGDHTFRVLHEPDPATQDFPDLTASADPCGDATATAGFIDHPPVYDQPRMRTNANGTCTVPAGTVFMLGDNRDNSNDSRSWGVVPVGKLVGRVSSIWYSTNKKTGTGLARFGRID
jgi:signal peptidase I